MYKFLDAMIGSWNSSYVTSLYVDQTASSSHCQTLSRELIDHIQDTELDTVVSMIHHEVITPDMFGKLRSQTHDRTVIESQVSAFGLFGRHSKLPHNDQACWVRDPHVSATK